MNDHQRSQVTMATLQDVSAPVSLWLRLSGVLLSAGLMTAALPKWGLTPLGLVGLTPLLLALRGLRPGAAAVLGGLFGLGFNLGVCYWVAGVVQFYGHLPLALAGLVLFLLVAVLSLWPALWAAALALAWSRGASGILLGALAWAGLEWVRSWFLTGFPWMDLGYLLTPWTQLIQTADLGGVALSSVLAVGTNLALAAAVRGRVKPLALTLACWMLAFGYGGWRLAQVDKLAQAAPQVQVQVVQGNVDQARKWDQAFFHETLARYGQLSRQGEGLRLVVWPETAAPFYFGQGEPEDAVLQALARDLQAWLLFGAPAVEKVHGVDRYSNRAWLLSPQGQIVGHLDKAHLVPYGEYVPLKRFFSFLGKVVAQVGDYSPGPAGGVVPAWFGPVGALICYETIFPELAQAAVENGAVLLVNMTNDAWFGRTSAPYQHLAMLAWRAVETRRAVGRAAQTGVSALLDPAGRFVQTLDLGQAGQLLGPLPILREKTIYLRGGYLIAPACLAAAGLGLILCLRRRTRHALDH